METFSTFEPMQLWKRRDAPVAARPQLTKLWLKQHDALVVSKTSAGFDRSSIEAVSSLLKSISRQEFDSLKFLIFDFAHGDAKFAPAGEGFVELVAAIAELIVGAPVITIAWVRSPISGSDFDFAMHCAVIVAESGARFSFAGDPFALFGLYAALGRKLGFVKAERLIESDAVLSAEEAHEYLIVKDVVAPQPQYAGIEAYLMQVSRRYNASYAIFRAQRMAQPPVDRRGFEETGDETRV